MLVLRIPWDDWFDDSHKGAVWFGYQCTSDWREWAQLKRPTEEMQKISWQKSSHWVSNCFLIAQERNIAVWPFIYLFIFLQALVEKLSVSWSILQCGNNFSCLEGLIPHSVVFLIITLLKSTYPSICTLSSSGVFLLAPIYLQLQHGRRPCFATAGSLVASAKIHTGPWGTLLHALSPSLWSGSCACPLG